MSPDCRDFLEQLLQKNPMERLTWPGLLDHEFVKGRVFTVDQFSDSSVSSELDNIVLPFSSLRMIEEEETSENDSDSSTEHDSTETSTDET